MTESNIEVTATSSIKGTIGPYDGLKGVSDGYILDKIETLQEIQKTHYWKSSAWQQASELLQPLFKEMARRAQS